MARDAEPIGGDLGSKVDATASDNRRTIASYEGCASDYAQSTAPKPGSDDNGALLNFLAALPAGGRVLEIGSGPGWDADWIESRGVEVRRTDAALAFVEIQRARGARAELLNVVTDDLGGPYAGVIALYVFQHVDRARLSDVLVKVSRAMTAGGAFLFSLREGRADLVERGDSDRSYYVAEWEKPHLDRILDGLGFRESWARSSEDTDGRWLTILTVKAR